MPLSRALAQGAARVRFAGYVESQEQLTQTLAVLKLYSERHPDVEIVPEFTNFGAFTDKIATETAGGNAPDMFSVNVDLLAEYARRGVTMPLDQYIPDPIDLSTTCRARSTRRSSTASSSRSRTTRSRRRSSSTRRPSRRRASRSRRRCGPGNS